MNAPPSKRVSLLLTPLLLTAAIALVMLGAQRVPERRIHGQLRDILPPPAAGWTMHERPLAETPEMQKAVGELLNFDDGVFVDYLGPTGQRLSAYLAYWAPGRMSHRLVAVHTPDVCWVGGGWKKEKESDTSEVLPRLPNGEARVFSIQDTVEYVWFWHLVGNESKRYRTGSAPPWYAAITDLFKKGLNQREEQLFIRLSSNIALTSPEIAEPVQHLLSRIPWPAPVPTILQH